MSKHRSSARGRGGFLSVAEQETEKTRHQETKNPPLVKVNWQVRPDRLEALKLHAVKSRRKIYEVLDEALERPKPLERVREIRPPVAICHNPDLESELRGFLDTPHHDRIEEERLATLEVEPLDRAEVLGLLEEVSNLTKRHRAALPWTSPDKAVIALVGALICQ